MILLRWIFVDALGYNNLIVLIHSRVTILSNENLWRGTTYIAKHLAIVSISYINGTINHGENMKKLEFECRLAKELSVATIPSEVNIRKKSQKLGGIVRRRARMEGEGPTVYETLMGQFCGWRVQPISNSTHWFHLSLSLCLSISFFFFLRPFSIALPISRTALIIFRCCYFHPTIFLLSS